jgi:hypothetical protein
MLIYVRCGVFTTATMKNISCNGKCLLFRPTPFSSFLICFLFDSENGGEIFFRNAVLSSNYTVLNPEYSILLVNM